MTVIENLLDFAPDAMLAVRRDGEIVLANDQAAAIFGYPRAKLLGKAADLLVPTQFRELNQALTERYFDNPGTPQAGGEMTILGLRSDGAEFRAEVTLSSAEVEPEGRLVFIAVRDIGHRAPAEREQALLAEVELSRRRESAQEAESRRAHEELQAIIDRAPMPIYVKDRDFRFVLVNRAVARMAGVRPSELIGKTVEGCMDSAALEVSRAGDRQVLSDGTTYEAEDNLTVKGVEKTLLTTKFPLFDDTGQVYGVCGISADITEKKQFERKLDGLAMSQASAIDELRASRQETIERLAMAVELRDPETGRHVNRIAAIAAFLGYELGFDADRAQVLLAAAPMHDVGKIGIADEILLKPGPLSPEERIEMQRHTTIGHELLSGSTSEFLSHAATIALTHHERWDGGGYPQGLAGEEIPLEGRIVAVADVFDALLSDRPYRPALDPDLAFDVIRADLGTHFDPHVAQTLLDHADAVLTLRRGAADMDPPQPLIPVAAGSRG